MRRYACPWHPVACGVGLSIAAHAALALVAWGAAVPVEARRAASLSVRLIERSPALATAAAVRVDAAVVVRRESPRRRAEARPPAIVAARSGSVAAAEMPSPPAEIISGAVFALPHIGFGGATAATSWTRAVRPPTPSVQPVQPDLGFPAAQAQREAGRALLVAALEQQIGALPAPVESIEGACTLGAQTELQLDCDNRALHAAVTPQARALSGLLLAYRSIDSRTAGLLIGFSKGRYQVSLAMDTEQR